MARAWRGLEAMLAWVARAWRGHGAGIGLKKFPSLAGHKSVNCAMAYITAVYMLGQKRARSGTTRPRSMPMLGGAVNARFRIVLPPCLPHCRCTIAVLLPHAALFCCTIYSTSLWWCATDAEPDLGGSPRCPVRQSGCEGVQH
eukprot:gene8420-biopygen19636